MPLKQREDGDYELFETTKDHRILVLDGRKWAAWVEGQAGEILVETDEDHKKKKTLGKGKYMMLDFENDPKFKDMPHLFLERDGAYHELMLPKGWPTSSDKQKKVVDTDNDVPKDEIENYVSGDMPEGPGEKRMKRPGGGAISNVTHHLKGFDFPASLNQLKSHARDKNAPHEVIEQLDKLPDRKYSSMADVTGEIGERTEHVPIENYDDLSAEEAAEAVADLSQDEVDIVERYEKDTYNRVHVRKAIDAKRNPNIPDRYFQMKAGELVDKLDDMSPKQLQVLRDFEKDHMSRKSVLEAIEQQLNQ